MSDRNGTDELVISLLREVVPWRVARGTIEPTASLADDLGIDSLGLVALAFRLAEKLELEFDDDYEIDFASIETVKDVQTMVTALQDALT